MGGRFTTINSYHITFDPQNLVDFKYLVQIVIRKGSHDIFTFINDILKPIGKIADRDIIEGTKHHRITILVVTTLRRFESSFVVDFNRSVFVDFEYNKPLAKCARCFSLDHTKRDCIVTKDSRVVPSCTLPGPPWRPKEDKRPKNNQPRRRPIQ